MMVRSLAGLEQAKVERKYAGAAHDKLTEEPQLFLHLFYYNKIDFLRREEHAERQRRWHKN